MKGKAKTTRKPNNINISSAKISWKLDDPPQELEDIISPALLHQLKGKSINNLYLSPRNKRSLTGMKCKSTTRLVSRYQTRKELDESPKINHQNSSNYLGDMYGRKLRSGQLNATVDAQSQTVDSLTKLKLPPISMKNPTVLTPQLFKLKLFPMMEGPNPSQKLKSLDSPTSMENGIAQRSTQMSTYSFNVEGRPDLFDKNIVLGLFIYRDDEHEYDIELSTWGQSPANIDNAWFTVHPRPTAKVDSHSFRLSSIEECNTIHKIIWQEDQVIQFASYREHLTHDNILLEEDIEAWNYVDGRNYFRPENERVHMNLWLFNGNPPIDTKEVEIVIKSVQLPKNY